MRDILLFLAIFTMMVFIVAACMGCTPALATGATVATGAALVAAPWYVTFPWGQVIATVVGTGGVFAVVKYVLDYRLGVKKVKSEDKKEDNNMESEYVKAQADLRKELQGMIESLKKDVELLRSRVSCLESYIHTNGLPVPGWEPDKTEEVDASA